MYFLWWIKFCGSSEGQKTFSFMFQMKKQICFSGK